MTSLYSAAGLLLETEVTMRRNSQSKTWLVARMVLMIGAAAVVVFAPAPGPGDLPGGWVGESDVPVVVRLFSALGAFVMLLVLPFILAVLILFQSFNPMSDDVWERPHHRANPLRFGNPLLFFHFAGWCVFASGAGMVLRSVTGELGFLFHGLFGIAAGGSILAGVRLGMRWCPKKMAPPQPHRRQGSANDEADEEGVTASRPPIQDKGAQARNKLFGFILNGFRWASLLWLVAGLAVGGYLLHRLESSILVPATVVEFRTSMGDSGRMYKPVYELTGRSGKSVRSLGTYWSSHPGLEVGEAVEVYYDPNDPGTVLRPGITTWILPIGFCSVGIAAFIVLSIVIYVRRRRANAH
jgi:hypothetical protein